MNEMHLSVTLLPI